MGALMLAFDWSKSLLGPVEQWSPTLQMMTKFLLANRFPLLLWWGPQFCQLYNDAYIPVLGDKHPHAALGRPFSECWSEVFPILEPLARTPYEGGPATWAEDIPLEVNRFGFMEETHFTIAYSPVPDETAPGGIGGVLATVHEISEKVVGERRTRLLRDLGAAELEERTAEEACARAAAVLARYPKDVPFALLYLLDSNHSSARLAGSAGLNPGDPAGPAIVELGSGSSVWPLSDVLTTSEILVVEDLKHKMTTVPPGPWSDPPDRAAVVPIRSNVAHRLAGFLVAGISPRLRLDDGYKGFLELTAAQIATAVNDAIAYEQERKRAEQLAELDRAKTQFFSNVSHEFRTPLTLMLGPLEDVLPEARERLSPERLEQLATARRNALRLLKLVNSLLDFSRIEASRVQAVYQPTDLAALTSEITSVFRSAMERAGLRYTVECEPLPEPVYVDRDMWEKIVLNLLSNAFKFTFEGEVRVTLRSVNGHVELAVQDTGTGIPEQERERVFERFHRIENSRSRSYEGTGIGLALVQELVRLHGGTVRVGSELGRGSAFTVTIPRGHAHLPAERIQPVQADVSRALSAEAYVEEAERWLPNLAAVTGEPHTATVPANAEAETPETAAEEVTLLIADDNTDMREYLVHLLSGEYRVHAVGDGEQAVEAARRLRPSLVLADVMMPRLDGFSLLRAIRHDPELAGIPVILLSARAGEESRVEGLQAGADDYLVKPFTARELLARVATHVNMAKLRRQVADRESRLRAEAELERRRLQELLALAPAAIGLLSGPEHRWTYVNELYLKVTGRNSPSDFIGKTIADTLPELRTQVYRDLLDEVYRTGVPFSGREMKVVLNRGARGEPEEAYFDFVYQPVRDAGGSVKGILVHAVEVTDKVLARKAVEERERLLRESEQRFRVITEATPVMVWMSGTDKLCTYFNKSWLQFVGRTMEQERGNGWAENVHPEDLERCVQIYSTFFDARKPFEMEYRLRHHSGQYRWILDCGVPRFAPDGAFEGYVGGCLDIHEQKEAAEKVKTALIASQRLAAIVESSDDAIVSKDLNGIVTSWNPGAERMFGYTSEEMVGRSIRTIIPPERQEDEDRILATIARGERIEHFETVRTTKSGERIEVSLTISPVKDENGRIVGAAKIARDITQRNRAERALRTSERLASVGRLAATVAHEINNPLEAVTNLVYLARGEAQREHVRMYLAAADEELARISLLTKQTLGFYRETTGAVPMRVGGLVVPLISVFASRTRNKSVEIRPEIRQDPQIEAVPGEIRQLLANLISNSIDAVGGGGHIRVRISSASQWSGVRRPGVRVTVADTGPGIPPELRPRLFEPFFTTKKDVGTGLGLWVCKSVVEKHLGSIRVRTSTTRGRSWTAFSIFLPAVQEIAAEETLRKAV